MDGIKIFKKPCLTVFNCICVFMAIYYTMIQIKTYFDNENLPYMSMRSLLPVYNRQCFV